MGCLAALSRFVSRLGEKGLPLYRLLRKAECVTWTPEAEEALGNLKVLLTNTPILVPPATGEALLIYVAATTQMVSAAIVVERREEGGGNQKEDNRKRYPAKYASNDIHAFFEKLDVRN